MSFLNGKEKKPPFDEPTCPIAKMVCPRNNDPRSGTYCPAWTEYVETNIQTGDEKITKECMFQALPKFMIETLKASNRPAAAMESTRNELAKGFSEISRQVQKLPVSLHMLMGDRDDRGGRDLEASRTHLIATDKDDDETSA